MLKINENQRKHIDSMLREYKTNKTNRKTHRALFIDGGGTKGIFASRVIENMGKEEFDKFNIFAGTSIGAILALGYNTLEFDKTHKIFIKKLSKIFNTTAFTKGWNLIFRKSLYNFKKKRRVFKSIFEDKRIGDLPKDKCFFITSTNFATGETEIFENVTGKWDHLYLWEAAMYTSDAPFYFNNKKSPYLDGGLYANDPREIFLTISGENEIPKDIEKFLSIGLHGKYQKISEQELLRYGSIKKISRILDILINIDALNNDKWFNKSTQFQHLRVTLDTKKIIPVNKLDKELLKIMNNEADAFKDQIKQFLDK